MKKHQLAKYLIVFLFAVLSPMGMQNLRADSVKLKSGEVFEGKITFETADVVKIQVPISASINETKTFLRSDVIEIVKAAADDVAMAELEKLLPTPSLLKASDYQTIIETQVQPFLNSYLDSKHKPAVTKILEELKIEKDKVERGQIKLENEWIDAQTQREFKARTDSRILNLLMRRDAEGKNLLGALRRFEILEEQYFGAPAFIEAIPVVLKILPAYGQSLARSLQNVEYRSKKWEEDKMLLDEVERSRVEAARQREMALYEKRIEAEKAKGVKWKSVNPMSKEDLQANVGLVRSEMTRIQGIDTAQLTEQSKMLVEADELIAKGNLEKAKIIIKEAGGSLKKSSRSSSKKGGTKSSYVRKLSEKIIAKEEAFAEAEVAKKSSQEGKQTAGVINVAAATAAAEEGGAEATGEEESSSGATDAMTGLMATNKKDSEEKKAGEKGKSKPKRTAKPTASSSREADEDEEEKPLATVGGFNLNIKHLIWIAAGLLVVVTVAMKVFGIGGDRNG